MAKATKKVDPKAVAKKDVMELIGQTLTDVGYSVVDGVEYGMNTGTIIVRGEQFDIQIKPITPKAGVSRYEVLTE